MHWYVDVLRKYAVFDGRARRKEFWMFTLINAIIGGILEIIRWGTDRWFLHAIAGAYGFVLIIPSIAVAVRRLHDSNRTGFWWFIWLIPFIGWIWFLVLMVLDGTPGPNRYGPDPKRQLTSGPAMQTYYTPR